ncbi:hypothetical protein HV205_12835 [Klebsiella sp. RHBSTW-00465]|uniref:hypothetical protein n=1 Tax=Klebsiella sp. RHBSTW-00465 TaxID=2742650 RepID=UPI0015F7197F|nr:hypothetical protein [Klebsiella sp. RHBSTW-00465]MBA7845333.1 hypothetical protein [Klebsiella sp. RHBSTW-00465]
MAYTYSEALEQLNILLRDGNVTVAKLEKLVADTSAKVPQAGPDSIYLLYSGETQGVRSVDTATDVSNKKRNVLVIDDSPVGLLLRDKRFEYAYFISRRDEYRATIPGFKDLSLEEQGDIVSRDHQLAISGKDTSGKRITSDSLWDQASKRFVEEASGSFRILATDALGFSLFCQTELPPFLKIKTSAFTVSQI